MATAATAEDPIALAASRGGDRLQLALIAAMAIALAAAPFSLYPVFLMKVLCFALFACAFNLLLGFVGLLSFGHAAYFGGGAYIAGFTAKAWGFPPEFAVLSAGLVAAVLGAAIGWLAIRRAGIYFAMITLALAQMVYFVAIQAPFTGGEDGLQGVPRNALLGLVPIAPDRSFYWFVLAIFLGGFLLIRRIVHSPFGQVLKAIRDNEPRAISLGYDVERYKLVAFVLSAGLAGVAGGTKALVFQFATLTDVHWSMSGEVVLMTLIGGMGTIFGPVMGAVVVVTMQNYLAELGAWVLVIQGAIFVACVLAFRRGIVGELAARLRLSL